MWRSFDERAESARERLILARELWGWIPHRGQERLLRCPAQIRVAACGRRWGKTEALSVDIATLAIAEARAGRECRQLIVAPTDAQARILGDSVLQRICTAFDQCSPWTDCLSWEMHRMPALRIALRRVSEQARAAAKAPLIGPVSEICCRTAGRDGVSLRGLWAHRIVVDEASRVPDIVMADVLLPMLMDVGGEYLLASSPAGRRSEFYRLYARGMSETQLAASLGGGTHLPASLGSSRSGRMRSSEGEESPTSSPSRFGRGGEALRAGVGSSGAKERDTDLTIASFQCPTTDNPHNDSAFLAAVRDELSDSMYAQEILAEFTDDFGCVFREDEIIACLAADERVTLDSGALRSEPVAGRLYAAGVDWGRSVDFTVLAILDATDIPPRLVLLERWQGATWETLVAAVAETVARFGPVKVLTDGTSIGDPVTEALRGAVREAQRRLGISDPPYVRIERYVFTSESKLALMDGLALALSRRGVLYPHHAGLLAELRSFEYAGAGNSGRPRMAARGAGHDDIVAALALALWCAPPGAPEPPASRILLGSMAGVGRG